MGSSRWRNTVTSDRASSPCLWCVVCVAAGSDVGLIKKNVFYETPLLKGCFQHKW
jgi:hypothetical protein